MVRKICIVNFVIITIGKSGKKEGFFDTLRNRSLNFCNNYKSIGKNYRFFLLESVKIID